MTFTCIDIGEAIDRGDGCPGCGAKEYEDCRHPQANRDGICPYWHQPACPLFEIAVSDCAYDWSACTCGDGELPANLDSQKPSDEGPDA